MRGVRWTGVRGLRPYKGLRNSLDLKRGCVTPFLEWAGRLTLGQAAGRCRSASFLARGGWAQRAQMSCQKSECCFVLLEPTPKVYRVPAVPRVNPGVTAPKLFSPTSVAGYAGPSSSLQTTTEVPVLLPEVQSGVLHLLGLISGVRRGGRELPPHFVLGP